MSLAGPKCSKAYLATAAGLLAAILLATAALVAFVRPNSWPHLTARHSLPSSLLLASADAQLQQQDSRLEVLRGCTNFACLRAAHALPHSPGGLFNFPHFVLLGYPKCATSSLTAYFNAHPQAVGSTPKEPWFFTRNGNCTHRDSSVPWGCSQRGQQRYLLETLHRDAAPAEVVAGMWRELPWLKVVVSMREPISQKISSIVHWGELMTLDPRPDWFQKLELDRIVYPRRDCAARLFANESTMYECLLVAFGEHAELQGEYHANLATWLTNYPRAQLHVVQYENLTANAAAVLSDLQLFLGLDPALAPAELPLKNIRKTKYQSQGWPMKRREYEHILSIARPRAQQTAAILEQHGFADAKEWLAPWETAWQRNLASCKPSGDCLIQLT